jgi:hypothetical protein
MAIPNLDISTGAKFVIGENEKLKALSESNNPMQINAGLSCQSLLTGRHGSSVMQ